MEIKRVKLDKFDFKHLCKYCLAYKKPFIIENFFDHMPSLSFWDPSYLLKKIGNNIVKINVSLNGIFNLNYNTGEFIQSKEMAFDDYVSTLKNSDSTLKLYLQQMSIINDTSSLKNDLMHYFKSDDINIEDINLWFGPGGNISPLHFDSSNNFFIQTHGSKKISLFSPRHFYCLYPNSFRSKARHMSKVNIDEINLKKFPNFYKADRSELVINQGEFLFIPAYWWHQVSSLTTNISLSIWWPALLKQKLVLGYLHNFMHKLLS